jgi:7,8-dihydropterin-6-yl-methyl-4-(beta-D-ribofuranosyl)aminobenzene 5'-phosphate synthase
MPVEKTVTILCDNNVTKSGFIGEHGFSCLIETGREKFLFDTGPGMSLPLNLKAAHKDLGGLDRVFISHGHDDHTGGLQWVLEQVGKVEVVAHPAIFSRHMLQEAGDRAGSPRYIGCPHTQEELEKSGAVFRFIDHTQEVGSGLWFVTGIDLDPRQFPKDPRLVLPQEQQFVPDRVPDDASLLLETVTDPLLILGCAHSGILNIVDFLKKNMGIQKLSAVLGGTHLQFYDKELIPRVIEKLEEFSVGLAGVSHCTGFEAAAELYGHFGDRFRLASAGSVFKL